MRHIDSESPTDVMRWLQGEAAVLWPAFLGSLSLRRSRCVRPNCTACLSGEQHQSYLLYDRAEGVCEPDATMQPPPQDNQLMSKHRVLSLEPHLRLERRGHGGQDETEKSDHSASLGNFITSSTRTGFSVHTGAVCGRWPRELVVNVAARRWALRRCVVLTQKWAKRAAALQHARPIMRLRLICRVWATCAACGAEYDYDARAHTFLRVVRSGVPDDEGEANAS